MERDDLGDFLMRMRFVLAAALLTACSHQDADLVCPGTSMRGGEAGLQEDRKMAIPPRNLLEVLDNLKLALVNDDLIKPEFYSEKNIEAISGGGGVHFRIGMSSEKMAWVSDFNALVAPVNVAGSTLPALQYTVDMGIRPSGQRWAEASVYLRESLSQLKFACVVRLLGSDWHDYPDTELHPHKIVPPPTDPRGNSRIRYILNGSRVNRSVILEFFPNGTLYAADFSLETE